MVVSVPASLGTETSYQNSFVVLKVEGTCFEQHKMRETKNENNISALLKSSQTHVKERKKKGLSLREFQSIHRRGANNVIAGEYY